MPPDATDTDSRRQGAVSSTYLGLTDHVLPLLAEVDAWLLAKRPKTRHLTLLAGYVHFFPGPFFQAPPAFKAVDYFTTWAAYKF
ncbi:hypothetical protein J0H58_21115 [bacterium]|nr:hypothetical protein [bacterium]